MGKSISIINNEKGSLILIVVLILISVTVLGIFALNTTTVEIQIAGNDKFHKMAFHNADSGIYTVPKVISEAVNIKATPNLDDPAYRDRDPDRDQFSLYTYLNPGSSDYAEDATTFYRQLAGFDSYNATPDIEFALARIDPDDADLYKGTLAGNDIVRVDVERLKTINIAGGGAEFASGAEGGGSSLKGIYFGLDSFGSGPGNSKSNVGARYLKVVGAAGGM